MADFDEIPSRRALDDDLSVGSSSGGSMLPLALAVVALLLGAAALYFALSGQGAAGDLEETLRAEILSEGEKASALRSELAEITTALERVQRQEAQVRSQVQNLTNDVQSALNRVGQELGTTKRQSAANAESIKEIVERLQTYFATAEASGSTETASEVSTEQRSEDSTAAAPEGYQEHTVRSGDTFGRMAREYGVSVSTIIDANPDLNPNRLQIGQSVLIPLAAE